MNWLHRIFSQGRLERELDAELRFHFEQGVADAMRAGLSEAEARRALRLQLGGLDQMKEECREARGTEWLSDALADLRVAWRSVRKGPGFAAAAIGVLALGIGGNSAIFSVVNAAFFRPLPYRDSARLVYVREQTSTGFTESVVPVAEFAAWKRAGVFEAAVGYQLANGLDLKAPGHFPEQVECVRVTPDFFSTLGIAPQRGRDFRPGDSGSGVAMLSDSLWRRSFGASPAAIGATALVNGATYTIAGVLPRDFSFPGWEFHGWQPPDIYLPVDIPAAEMASHKGGPFLFTIGRLRPGIGLEQAQARLQTATRELDAALPGWWVHAPGTSWVAATPLQAHLTGTARAPLTLMMVAAICMLLIAYANVANLQLARALTREKEVAARAALGASRFRLLRLLTAESLLLTAAGCALGMVLAGLAAPALRFLLPKAIPTSSPLDWRALIFTAASTLCAAFIVGLAPALTALRMDLSSVLKEGGPPAMSRTGRGRLRGSLAIAQLALSLALLAGAGLLLRSFVKLVSVDVGFDAQNVAATRMEGLDFRRALAAVRELPKVETAALASQPPVTHYGGAIGFLRSPAARSDVRSYLSAVSPDYFATLRIPLLAGRAFQDGDKLGWPRVVILSQSAARQLFGSAGALGQRITGTLSAPGATDKWVWFTVVGVVGDVRHQGYQDEMVAEVYQPFEQAPYRQMALVARSRFPSATLAPALQHAVQRVDPAEKLPPAVRPEDLLSESVTQRRQRTLLLGAFAVLSLLVAIVGVYGVVAYSVALRTHEIGVRMALGAQPRDVLRMVLREGLMLAAAGGAIGVVLALWLSRALAGFLFGVGPWDALTFLAAVVILAAAVVLASYLPARQATRVNPAAALRFD